MKTFISLFGLILSISLTAQTNPATWYLNDTSGSGIQSPTNTASGENSTAMGGYTLASGYYSTAMGAYTTASGYYSTASGNGSTASGNWAIAMGKQSQAVGNNSVAIGRAAVAGSDYDIAIGELANASGHLSVAIGQETEALGLRSTAIGAFAIASGLSAVAIGSNLEASGQTATAMGNSTTASGDFSTSMSLNTTASDYASLVVGQYNSAGSSVTNSATSFKLENTAFVIGNGADYSSRSDALVVKFNGDATLAGNLNINSDARLKANIVSLGSTLSKLLQIDGKSYTMKKDESEKQKIGLLAQDIEKVFPELVSESHGVKSVNYQGLVPVLINALKEQQSEIDELKTMLKAIIEKT